MFKTANEMRQYIIEKNAVYIKEAIANAANEGRKKVLVNKVESEVASELKALGYEIIISPRGEGACITWE